jgi:hypothetical protein
MSNNRQLFNYFLPFSVILAIILAILVNPRVTTETILVAFAVIVAFVIISILQFIKLIK